jgi:hypothetical protein
MKQLIFSFVAIIAITSFSACNRNYTCECKNNYTGEILTGNIMSRNAKDARQYCFIKDTASRPYYNCDIK